MRKFNSTEIVVYGLDGLPKLEVDAGKELGNLLYEKTSTLDWLQHSKDIYEHKEIELDEEKLTYLVSILVHPQANVPIMVKEAILNYIKRPEPQKEEKV